MTLDELKAARILEIRQAAELDFWDLFIDHPHDIPILALEYVTMGALLGRNLAVAERDRFNAARSLINRMRAQCDRIAAATTEAEVLAEVWGG